MTVPIAILGCGNIAGEYAKTFTDSDVVGLRGVFDLDPERAAAFGAEHDARAYASLEELLADDIEIVVNLTIHHAHFDTTKAAIAAGKNVYSEKPLALTSSDAHELVRLARDRGVQLACSPFTWLGAAQLAALREIRSGRLGDVRAIYAEVNHGRIETWHPNPAPFYEVGVVGDVGVYPLTLLTAFFGPVVAVEASGHTLLRERSTLDGEPFEATKPDLVVSMLELANGAVVRLTTSFYVTSSTEPQGIEFHGDEGSLRLGNWIDPNASVEFAAFGDTYDTTVEVEYELPELAWGFGVEDMARRLRHGKGPRTTGAHAAHIVDVMEAIDEAIETGGRAAVSSTFPDPID